MHIVWTLKIYIYYLNFKHKEHHFFSNLTKGNQLIVHQIFIL